MRARLRLVVVVTVVGAAVGPVGLPSAAAACAGVKVSGRWSSIDLPAVPSAVPGASTPADYISSYAVAAGRPSLLYAAGGRQVFRSRDGGCSWQVAVSLDTAGGTTAPSRLDPAYVFVDVIVPNTVPGVTSSTVYALAVDWTSSLTVSPPVVLAVSRDDGATWRISEPPPAELAPDYPRCGSGHLLAGADPKAVYLSCSSVGFAESLATLGLVRCAVSFYVSRTDGVSWTPIDPGVAAPCLTSRWSALGPVPVAVADARSPGWLWGLRGAYATEGPVARLILSVDDGRTAVDRFATSGAGLSPRVAVSAPSGQGPRRAVIYGGTSMFLSTDGGVSANKLSSTPVPTDARNPFVGAFFDPTGGALYALTSNAQGTDLAPFRYDLRTGRWTVLPPLPAPKQTAANFGQFRTDNARPLGLYALASATSATPARLVLFR